MKRFYEAYERAPWWMKLLFHLTSTPGNEQRAMDALVTAMEKTDENRRP